MIKIKANKATVLKDYVLVPGQAPKTTEKPCLEKAKGDCVLTRFKTA